MVMLPRIVTYMFPPDCCIPVISIPELVARPLHHYCHDGPRILCGSFVGLLRRYCGRVFLVCF